MPCYVDLADPKRLLRSQSALKRPSGTWSDGFDLTEHARIAAISPRYRKVTGTGTAPSRVVEMDAGEKAAVDAAAATAADDERMAAFVRRDALAAFAELMLDELNMHAARVSSLLDAIDGATNLATLKSSVGAINNLPQRTSQQLRTAIRAKLEAI